MMRSTITVVGLAAITLVIPNAAITLDFPARTDGAEQIRNDIDKLMAQTAGMARSPNLANAVIQIAALLIVHDFVVQIADDEIATADIHMALNQADNGTPILTITMDGAEHDFVIDDHVIEAVALTLASHDRMIEVEANGENAAMGDLIGIMDGSKMHDEMRDREPSHTTRHIFSGIGQKLANKARAYIDGMMVATMFGNPAISRTGDRYHMAA